MTKTIYWLKGLDCPNCAQKIALRVGDLEIVESADMDFMRKKLIVHHSEEHSRESIDSSVKMIVGNLEPDVEVLDYEQKEHHEHHHEHEHCHCDDHAHEHEHGHSHEHGHEHSHVHGKGESHTFDIARFIIAGVLYALGMILPYKVPSMVLSLCAYVIAGYDVVLSALRNLVHGEAFDETLLMFIATIGAVALGYFDEAAAVMLFFQVGELLQDIAVERSRKSVTKLLELKPEYARIIREGKELTVAPEQVETGDIMVVRAGERLALDGEVVEGSCQLDTSAVTGEFLPVSISKGKSVLSGCTDLDGVIKVRVSAPFKESSVARIMQLVENASEKKAETEKFITRFARVYTPAVVACAVLLTIVPCLFLGFSQFTKWLYRGLLFLVISCPCALVISIPLGFFAGIGGASKQGILVKGAKAIEALSKCTAIAVDKTGTLTKGEFSVESIVPSGISQQLLLEYAAAAESVSNHPIAVSILKHWGKSFEQGEISNASEISGCGVECDYNGKKLICAKREYLVDMGIRVPQAQSSSTSVYVSCDGEYCGYITLGDEIKENARQAVAQLTQLGVDTVMLTGDKEQAAAAAAEKLGIKNYHSSLLPQDKVTKVEDLMKASGGTPVGFAGDGINDAPVIARADVGFAMGGLGSDIAIEAADIVLMNDSVESIPKAVAAARKTMRIVKENIVFALGVKFLVMMLGALGLAGMWMAVFADVGVALLAILNAMRCSKA
ncbi:MAG: cadmium-translocating P-type ATPase [Ruminococcus sp.]|nr:cadmium-translocating P-type ATPase [Ruminococcus sp.]